MNKVTNIQVLQHSEKIPNKQENCSFWRRTLFVRSEWLVKLFTHHVWGPSLAVVTFNVSFYSSGPVCLTSLQDPFRIPVWFTSSYPVPEGFVLLGEWRLSVPVQRPYQMQLPFCQSHFRHLLHTAPIKQFDVRLQKTNTKKTGNVRKT
jgi:hypothetical protein